MGMERKELINIDKERIEEVLRTLRKQAPLTVKQEKFCSDASVERFLRSKGDNVKKAAKQLRATLSWRDSIGTDHLIADEFSAELADGLAYVAGHDNEARPVMVFRIKQDHHKIYSQKSFVRLLVFTLETAISSMPRLVDQFVLLFDASHFSSASAFLSVFMGALKIISEYYPGRLHKAFVIDPPSLFSYLWKGVRPFVELSTVTAAVSSLDFGDSLDDDDAFASYPARSASLRFDPTVTPATVATAAKFGTGSVSSRFSFTVSRFDSLKPWYLSTTTTSAMRAVAATASSPSLVGASPLSARSSSFASPGGRSACIASRSMPSTPCSFLPPKQLWQRRRQQQQQSRMPRPSFLQSPATLFSFRKEGQGVLVTRRADRARESFLPFLRFYRRPYDEMVYRATTRPSTVSPHLKQQQQQRRDVINVHHHHQGM